MDEPGLFYALQRMTAEAVLSLLLIESKIKDRPTSKTKR
jgi:hypothetical protein